MYVFCPEIIEIEITVEQEMPGQDQDEIPVVEEVPGHDQGEIPRWIPAPCDNAIVMV